MCWIFQIIFVILQKICVYWNIRHYRKMTTIIMFSNVPICHNDRSFRKLNIQMMKMKFHFIFVHKRIKIGNNRQNVNKMKRRESIFLEARVLMIIQILQMLSSGLTIDSVRTEILLTSTFVITGTYVPVCIIRCRIRNPHHLEY